jgi:hypothetical protein
VTVMTDAPSLRDATLAADALIARLDASMTRIQALTDRLTVRIDRERKPDDERER